MAAQDMTGTGARPRGGSLPCAVFAVLFALLWIPAGLIALFTGPGPGAVDTATAIPLLTAGAGLCLVALATFSVRSEPTGLEYAKRLIWIARWVTFVGALVGLVVGVVGDMVTDSEFVSWVSAALVGGIGIIVTFFLAQFTILRLYMAG